MTAYGPYTCGSASISCHLELKDDSSTQLNLLCAYEEKCNEQYELYRRIADNCEYLLSKWCVIHEIASFFRFRKF